ncbi:MAG: DegV family protein [Clostridia bacterium]|nr:DegV family protein [Clostridia bacterium]
MSFSIITDSCSNLTNEQIKNYNIKVVPLTYSIGDTEHLGYIEGEEFDYKAYYELLRSKVHIKTSLVSYERVENALKEELDKGNDVLYLAFSSALSGSYQVAKNCASDISDNYPERKIIVVDTLQASMGQGLMVKYAVDKRNEGLSLTETAAWLEENKLNFVALFTVDDLFFLKRGGRLSGAVAVVGTILNIKPLLHVDNEGKLVSTGTIRGRAKSIDALISRMGETGVDLKGQDIFMVHGDCIEEAEAAAAKIKEKFGVRSVTINYVDQVISSHSGPGTLAIFYIGSER